MYFCLFLHEHWLFSVLDKIILHISISSFWKTGSTTSEIQQHENLHCACLFGKSFRLKAIALQLYHFFLTAMKLWGNALTSTDGGMSRFKACWDMQNKSRFHNLQMAPWESAWAECLRFVQLIGNLSDYIKPYWIPWKLMSRHVDINVVYQVLDCALSWINQRGKHWSYAFSADDRNLNCQFVLGSEPL